MDFSVKNNKIQSLISVSHLFVRVTQGVLEGGDVFETVTGNDSVIVVSIDQEDSRVLTLLLRDVVERGDGAEVGELVRDVTAPVVTDPGIAHCELLESQQVHHSEIEQSYY